MDTSGDIIRELHAREALRDLVSSYCRAADNCQTGRLEKLFHPEGLVDSGVIRAQPKEFSERFVAWLKQNTVSVFHAICGAQFEVSGDHATGDNQVLALCQMNPAHGGKRIVTAGRYADKYVIHEGRWVISERFFGPELSWDFPSPVEPSHGQ
jgi:hypothetical protein